MARRLAAFFLTALLCWAGALIGLWFIPFVAGVGFGALPPRRRGTVPLVAVGAVAGWAVSLWAIALDGLPAGATARAIAALAGLPPYAAVAVAVTLLLAALQALAGGWLARAVFPRTQAAAGPAAGPAALAQATGAAGEPGDPPAADSRT
jgi:hypothetical protein